MFDFYVVQILENSISSNYHKILKEVLISNYGKIKLNSFRPLCMTETGLNAVEKYNLAPFIDASCRREPDFENPFPSITALCRQGQFAPHLRVNDIIVYMTISGEFQPFKKGYHLVANYSIPVKTLIKICEAFSIN